MIQEVLGCTSCISRQMQIMKNIIVQPYIAYALEVHLMRTDTDLDSEYAEIFIGDESIGKCNPDGQEGDCNYFSCNVMNHRQNVPKQAISSKDGIIKFQVKYSKEVDIYNSTICTSRGITAAGIARVTLTKSKYTITLNLCKY